MMIRRRYRTATAIVAVEPMVMVADLCKIAYDSDVDEKLLALGGISTFTYRHDNMFALTVELDSMIVVVFRGMECGEEFSEFMKIWKVKADRFKFHSGFFSRCNILASAIIHDLSGLPTTEKRLVFAGHSCGGAMAMLLTFFKKPDMICTYGAPKVSYGEKYAELYNGIDVRRFEIKSDWISKLPPYIPYILEYEHIGSPIILENSKGDISDGRNSLLSSHRIDNYVDGIRNKYNKSEK